MSSWGPGGCGGRRSAEGSGGGEGGRGGGRRRRRPGGSGEEDGAVSTTSPRSFLGVGAGVVTRAQLPQDRDGVRSGFSCRGAFAWLCSSATKAKPDRGGPGVGKG